MSAAPCLQGRQASSPERHACGKPGLRAHAHSLQSFECAHTLCLPRPPCKKMSRVLSCCACWLCTTNAICFLHMASNKRARTGLAQPQAWRAGDMSAEQYLLGEAYEQAGVTRLRQARLISARIRTQAYGETYGINGAVPPIRREAAVLSPLSFTSCRQTA